MTLLILCISVYIAIILSLDFFDDEKTSSKKSQAHHEQRMMTDMMRAPVGHSHRLRSWGGTRGCGGGGLGHAAVVRTRVGPCRIELLCPPHAHTPFRLQVKE